MYEIYGSLITILVIQERIYIHYGYVFRTAGGLSIFARGFYQSEDTFGLQL